jgi:hypothetical protein
VINHTGENDRPSLDHGLIARLSLSTSCSAFTF